MSSQANQDVVGEPIAAVVHVVWAVRYPGPRFYPVSDPLERREAVQFVAGEWSRGVMARLDPPLRASIKPKG